jgi:hypothetical protein
MAMVNRTICADHLGHEIKVTNHWFKGAKLFIDGNCCAHTRNPFALNKRKPVLNAVFEDRGQQQNIEVFAWAPMLKVHLKICVNNEKMGGDDF